MPTLPCPACERAAARLEGPDVDYAPVNYYRCDHCEHVWTTIKDGSSIVKHITPLTKRPSRPPVRP